MRTRMPAGLTGPRSLGILTGAAVMAVLVASCGGSSGNGPGVASLGTTTTVKATSSSAQGDPLKYSQCMRAHGITNFPDPSTSGGGISIQIKGGTNLDPNSPLFQSAQNACQKYLPGKAQGGTSLNTTGGGKGSGSGGAVSVGG